MGILRTLLAISVVLAHTTGSGLVGGRNAVQMFYVISGFLISFVLIEKRGYPSIRTFYVNRYLRLYPIYAVVAVATLVVLCLQPESPFWNVYASSPPSARLLLTLGNATLFGQDWVMFASVRDGQLVPTKDFYWSNPVLYPGLLAPQAWTLGVELTFYAIAPFILGRRKLVVGLLLASLGLRLFLIHLGFGSRDPWTYRFFPTELALFLLGALAHQWGMPIFRRLDAGTLRACASTAAIVVLALCLIYDWIPVDETIKSLVLLGSFIPVVPLLFEFQRWHVADRVIGDLSYPIYINHMFVVLCMESAWQKLGWHDRSLLAVACVGLSLGLAILLERFIGLPLERFRHRIKSRSAVQAVAQSGGQGAGLAR